MDEKEGRRRAQRLGLKVVGVVGVLMEAKKKGMVKRIRPFLDDLRQIAGFYLSDSLYDYTLEIASEGAIKQGKRPIIQSKGEKT